MYVKFVSQWVPQRYSDDASRRAVLFPLTGHIVQPASKDKSYLALADKKVQHVIKRWRRRLRELCSYGWMVGTNNKQLGICVDCCPSLMAMTPATYRCDRESICPFCYARRVQWLYKTTVTICKGIPRAARKDYCVLGFRKTIVSDDDLESVLANEVPSRTALYKRLKPFGAYLGATVEPIGAVDWKVSRRGLLLLPVATDLSTVDWADRIHRMKGYKGDKLAKLIGWTFRYPVSLLLGDDNAKRVVELLHQRKGSRLNASYGVYRGRSTTVS